MESDLSNVVVKAGEERVRERRQRAAKQISKQQ